LQAMEFRVLGPLEVCNDAGVVALGGPLPRALLAMLLHPNEAVPVGHRSAALGGTGRPRWRGPPLRLLYVARLRKRCESAIGW